MFERLGQDVRNAVMRAAHAEARALGSATVEAEHLLLALAADADSTVGRLLTAHGLDHDGLDAGLERETERSLAAVGVTLSDFRPADPRRSAPRRSPKLAASFKRALERAVGLASARGDRVITPAHLLVGILHADIGTVPRALAATHVDRVSLLARAEDLLPAGSA